MRTARKESDVSIATKSPCQGKREIQYDRQCLLSTDHGAETNCSAPESAMAGSVTNSRLII
jgi:hypothetical protein